MSLFESSYGAGSARQHTNAWRIAHGVRPSTDCILRDEGGKWDKKQRLPSCFELNVVPLQRITLLLIKHQKV